MTTSILSLALAYVFLLVLLLLAVVKSELGAGLKLTVVVLAGGFYIWHYNAMQASLGWPAGARLPAHFELISRVVIEPDLKRGEGGGIFVWLRDLERNESIPRAYRLPYGKHLHRKLDDTLKRQQQGERFVGKPSPAGDGARHGIEFEATARERPRQKTSSE